jgi:cell fate regulator YaaT (PSP1 superfamily)
VATEKDKEQYLENQDKEVNAFQVCLEKIKQHQLEMKLIDVEYTFDRNKIIFYFTADGRVDFRELVKDLASIFRTRIELRQIGVRDEAKMLGGLGPCGRSMCCATFLGEFDPVSIKMAKEQNLSLNPAKISGICGRLMCCLKYESESYREINNELPGIGGTVQYQGKNAVVVEQNLLKETLILQLSNQERIEVPLGEVDY